LIRNSKTELFGAIDQLGNLGVDRLSFTGGEPMLRDDLGELVRRGADNNMLVNVITNGTLLTEAKINEIIDAGAGVITLSLDTMDSRLYRHLRGIPIDRIEQSLTLLNKVAENGRVLVTLNCVITMLNLPDLPELLAHVRAHNMGISFQPFHPILGFQRSELMPTVQTVKDLNLAIENILEMKKRGFSILNTSRYLRALPKFMLGEKKLMKHCISGYANVNIDPRLNVRPCWLLSPIGNLRERSLKDIWKSQEFCQARDSMWKLDCPGCLLICHCEFAKL